MEGGGWGVWDVGSRSGMQRGWRKDSKGGRGGRLIEEEGKCRTVGELIDGSGASSHQLNGCDLSPPPPWGTAAGARLPPDLRGHLLHTEGHIQAFLLDM